MSSLTRYPFKRAANGFFELPVEIARRITPAYIEPIEMHHGTAVLSASAFDFRLDDGFEYQQMLMSIVVAPYVQDGGVYPRSALYPFIAATNHPLVRQEAAERWRLPQWHADVAIEFEERDHSLTVGMKDGNEPILELTVRDYRWETASGLYQCLMAAPDGRYMARFTVEGEHSEHEEGTGSLRLHDHPFNRELETAEIDSAPFREVWIRDGAQSFEPLVRLPDA